MTPPRLADRVSARHGAFLARVPAARDQLEQVIRRKEREIEIELGRSDPFEPCEARLRAAESALRDEKPSSSQFTQEIAAYAAFLQEANLPSDLAFWNGERQRLDSGQEGTQGPELLKARTLLVRNWRKKLDQARAAWELQQIQSLRDAFLEELLRWLAQLEVIENALGQLGIDPGRLLDFSAGSLSPQDMEQLTRWARYLQDDADVQALCALTGRAWQQERSYRLEKVKAQVRCETLAPDVHSREELVGIEFGRNVAHATPAEWMLLADPGSETLFDLKFAESRLLCFRMEGMQRVPQVQVHEQELAVADTQRGPMIVCVDTSGSMQGTPEHVAKAMALFLALQAQEEGRACYLINFSTGIDVLDLAGKFGLSTLMEFLRMSFHGGTDAAPAMEHALQMLQTEAFRRADVLVISDFVMAELPPRTLDAIAAQRHNENRFFSLCIGLGFPSSRAREHFDREWMFDPARSSIVELLQLRDGICAREA